MHADEKILANVLGGVNYFYIPDYQRPYSWGEKQTEQLLEDIKESFERKDDEYFIGALILIETTDQGFEIVDGQQRITTLTLLLTAISDALEKTEQKIEVRQFVLPQSAFESQNSGKRPRLKVRDKDRTFFEDTILLGNKDAIPTSDSQWSLLKNKQAIDKYIKENFSQDQVAQLYTFLINKIKFVWVSATNKNSAFRMFNVLNARGLQLSSADLIKNFLYSEANGNLGSEERIKLTWDNLENLIGTNNLDAFLGHYRTSRLANKADRTLYEEYGDLYKKLGMSVPEFCKNLEKAANLYQKIMQKNFEGNNCIKLIESLDRVVYDEWVPALLAYLDSEYKGISLLEFLSYLEKITYQNWIRRLGRAQRSTIYYQIIRHMRDNASPKDVIQLFRNSSKNDELTLLLQNDLYGMPYAKAVLLRLEDSDQDDSVVKKYDGIISIEHILPQTATDPYWLERFDVDKAKSLVHKMGNLTLLSGQKNASAQNDNFEKKKSAYNEKNKKVSFDMTKKVISIQEWNEDVLLRRHVEMVDKATKIWSIS